MPWLESATMALVVAQLSRVTVSSVSLGQSVAKRVCLFFEPGRHASED